MTDGTVRFQESRLDSGDRLAAITLAAPARCNSLEPIILNDLGTAVDRARDIGASYVTLRAEGRHFSTGGDVAAFEAARAAGDVEAYSETVVGALQDILRDLLSLPAIVLTGAQGAVTGGSAGLLFASDLVVLSEDAFLQPYFSAVGFSPDGGWSALLPERIGAGRALQIQLDNARITAPEAMAMGLARQVVPAPELDRSLMDWVNRLSRDHVASGMLAAKRLIWDESRRASVNVRLKAELDSFKRQIRATETAAGMQRFLSSLRSG